MEQAQVTKGRVVKINAALAAPPIDGTTEPHVILSPITPLGTPTMGFFLGLKAPTVEAPAVPVGSAFGITIWMRDPGTKEWFSGTIQNIAYGQGFVCYDVNACELYFAVTLVASEGYIHFHVMEQ